MKPGFVDICAIIWSLAMAVILALKRSPRWGLQAHAMGLTLRRRQERKAPRRSPARLEPKPSAAQSITEPWPVTSRGGATTRRGVAAFFFHRKQNSSNGALRSRPDLNRDIYTRTRWIK